MYICTHKVACFNGFEFLDLKKCLGLEGVHLPSWKIDSRTVDGRNPAPPGMYKTLYLNNGVNYQPQLVDKFFHQSYENHHEPDFVAAFHLEKILVTP